MGELYVLSWILSEDPHGHGVVGSDKPSDVSLRVIFRPKDALLCTIVALLEKSDYWGNSLSYLIQSVFFY